MLPFEVKFPRKESWG